MVYTVHRHLFCPDIQGQYGICRGFNVVQKSKLNDVVYSASTREPEGIRAFDPVR